MKMKLKTKGIIKKVALALAGVSAITAIGFGVKAIVDHTKDDLKTISPSFEIGSLGSDGKYIADESTLYTKEAFGCYGLQIKSDFDSTVNYQIFYYDILDNYISSTSVMSDGFSGEAPLNGAYARIVIEPKDDEDGKISWTEKISYPKQLTIKVNKKQDINNRFIVFSGKLMQRVNIISDLVFENEFCLNSTLLTWDEAKTTCVTSSTFLEVVGGSTINGSFSSVGGEDVKSYQVFEFTDLPSSENYIGFHDVNSSAEFEYTLNKKTKYIIISVYKSASGSGWTSTELSKLPSCFSITK